MYRLGRDDAQGADARAEGPRLRLFFMFSLTHDKYTSIRSLRHLSKKLCLNISTYATISEIVARECEWRET
ncbi:hypothetical protein Heshes_01770 [Alicyclobacillus hesperidum]|uniref:Uncharacterized protein n=1 Tax=Alicyclobacillus hesperidum TaxID=89784 RepID=A0AA37U942_9BACL|nr:hypothetical protein Heshes_01770 [Alicyclobacillus hesperidum]